MTGQDNFSNSIYHDIFTVDEIWCFICIIHSQNTVIGKKQKSFHLIVSKKRRKFCWKFFDSQNLVHQEFILQCYSVRKLIYINILHHIHNEITNKCPEKWKAKNWAFCTTEQQHIYPCWSSSDLYGTK